MPVAVGGGLCDDCSFGADEPDDCSFDDGARRIRYDAIEAAVSTEQRGGVGLR